MRIIFVLIFLALVALCTFFSKNLYQERIEADIQTKVQAVLEANDLGHMTASVKHHQLSLAGAATENEIRTAINAADHVWGAYMPAKPEVTPVVEALPASLIVNETADGNLILEGVLPNEELRARLVKAARGIPGVKAVDDQTTIDPTVTEPEWEGSVTSLLGELVPKAELASLSLKGQKFVVSGILPDEKTHMAVVAQAREAAGQLPLEDRTKVKERISKSWWLGHSRSFVPAFFKNTNGAGGLEQGKISDTKIALKMTKGAPQPSLVARLKGEDIVLDGLVKSASESAAIEKSVQAAQPDRKIINQLKVQENLAGAIWRDSIGSSVSDLFSNTQKPVVTAIGRMVKLEGEVTAEESKTAREDASSAALGDAIQVENLIAVVESPSMKLNNELKGLAVYFKTASSYVQKKEELKIKKVADAIKAAEGQFNLTVGGFADLRGNADYNKQLSLQRANAVRSKLVKLGVPGERMEVKFFGEDTSDVKKADLWKSRRVELSIVEQ